MRLIDADAIPYVLVKGLTSTRIAGKDTFDIAYRYVVERQPTIEAIPVEWLNSFKRLLVKDARWAIDEAISQWNRDEDIIDEAMVYIDGVFRRAKGGKK